MIEFLVCFGAFVIVLFFARLGMVSGGFLALSGMLTSIVSLFIAFRYWFIISRLASSYEKTAVPLLATVAFWVAFVTAGYVLKKLRENYTDAFESVHPSLVDRVMGAVFGCVTGLAVTTAAMMTVTILAAQYWPAYKPASLPLPVDRWGEEAYRFVETKIARVSPADPGHTLLPALRDASPDKSVAFWQ